MKLSVGVPVTCKPWEEFKLYEELYDVRVWAVGNFWIFGFECLNSQLGFRS